jgi:hypothetical protein
VDEDGEEETDLTEISEGPSYENIVVKPGKASDKPPETIIKTHEKINETLVNTQVME